MTTQKIEMTEEQLQTLAQVRNQIIELFNSQKIPDFTLVRKIDNLVEDLIK